MKESVAITKETDRKRESSPTRSDNSIQRLRNEPERQLGSLRDVIDNIRRNGGTPSVESIATELSVMPYSNRASTLLALQQTHGNHYVQRVVTGIQAKLKVGQPDDKYEQEADRVAEQVMQMPEPQVQRQRDDTHAQQVMKHVQAEKGSGHPMDTETRTEMETAFGQDFGEVRVHTSAEANKLAKELGAKAFTSGKDIFFKEGAYRPGSEAGRRLIGHELTHVVQQERVTRAGQVSAGQADDAFEQQAERTAEKVVHDQEASLKAIGAPPTIQRSDEVVWSPWSPYRRGGSPGVATPFYTTPARAPQPNIEEVVRGLALHAAPGSFALWFQQHYDSLLGACNPPRVGVSLASTTRELTFVSPNAEEIRQLTEIYLSLETFSTDTEDATYFAEQRERLQETVNIWGLEYQTAEEQREILAPTIDLSFQNRDEYRVFRTVMSWRPPEIQIQGAMDRWGRF